MRKTIIPTDFLGSAERLKENKKLVGGIALLRSITAGKVTSEKLEFRRTLYRAFIFNNSYNNECAISFLIITKLGFNNIHLYLSNINLASIQTPTA